MPKAAQVRPGPGIQIVRTPGLQIEIGRDGAVVEELLLAILERRRSEGKPSDLSHSLL